MDAHRCEMKWNTMEYAYNERDVWVANQSHDMHHGGSLQHEHSVKPFYKKLCK